LIQFEDACLFLGGKQYLGQYFTQIMQINGDKLGKKL